MGTKIRNLFVNPSLIKTVEKIEKEEKKNKNTKNSQGIEVQSRSTTILPNFVSKTFKIQNGKKFTALKVTEKIVGQKFGEFARTRLRGKDPRPKAENRR